MNDRRAAEIRHNYLSELYVERRLMGMSAPEAERFLVDLAQAGTAERLGQYAVAHGELAPIFKASEQRLHNAPPVRPLPQGAAPAPSPEKCLPDAHLYLKSQGVAAKVANEATLAAWLAFERYRTRANKTAYAETAGAVIARAGKIARAARALAKAIEGAPRKGIPRVPRLHTECDALDATWRAIEYAHGHPVVLTELPNLDAPGSGRVPMTQRVFHALIGRSYRPDAHSGQPYFESVSPRTFPSSAWRDRIGPRASFAADVRMVRDAANDALSLLKRPATAKAALVRELAIIWGRATRKLPSASGRGNFAAPRSAFGRFVTIVVAADADEFRTGLSDLLRTEVNQYRKLRGN
jgi:hypothetical protein